MIFPNIKTSVRLDRWWVFIMWRKQTIIAYWFSYNPFSSPDCCCKFVKNLLTFTEQQCNTWSNNMGGECKTTLWYSCRALIWQCQGKKTLNNVVQKQSSAVMQMQFNSRILIPFKIPQVLNPEKIIIKQTFIHIAAQCSLAGFTQRGTISLKPRFYLKCISVDINYFSCGGGRVLFSGFVWGFIFLCFTFCIWQHTSVSPVQSVS